MSAIDRRLSDLESTVRRFPVRGEPYRFDRFTPAQCGRFDELYRRAKDGPSLTDGEAGEFSGLLDLARTKETP